METDSGHGAGKISSMTFPKHSKGSLATVLVHGLLLLYLLMFGFKTPLPLPDEAGFLVDFGTDATGRGAMDPAASPVTVPEHVTAAPEETPDDQLTQDVEEVPPVQFKEPEPAVNTPPEPAPPAEKPSETPPEPVQQEEPEVREVNPQALFPGRSRTNSAQEGQTDTPGNQGTTSGVPNVQVYGEGSDAGGNSFNLSGRSLAGALPEPEYTRQTEGVVVIEITVDKEGTVVQARYQLRGSTTSDEFLVNAARAAALQTKFNRQPDATMQVGTITYIFKLQD